MPDNETIGSDVLEGWEILGSGGFGRVYKARNNKDLRDVAIKLLNEDVRCSPSSLLLMERELSNEVKNMEQASCPYVLRVCGRFEGIPPLEDYRRPTTGIVMEYMARGSIETLQENLDGPLPEPLAFRLAYEVALAIHYLHQRKLVHQDLKPSNVLLTDDFHAQLADFGLSIVSASARNSNRQTTEAVGGTYKYMPPEALVDISYQPRSDFDIYSYGIFLWSLFTGKEPYPGTRKDLVVDGVCRRKQRPRCDKFNQRIGAVEGLKDLVDLMNKCWAHTPSERPKSKACVEDTERVYSKHKKRIHDVVHQVSKLLEGDTNESVPPPGQSPSHDEVDARFSTQLSDSGSTDTMSDEDKVNFVRENMPEIIQEARAVMKIVDELGDMVPSEIYTEIDAQPEREKKMRKLYTTSLRSSDFVKVAFYTALKKHEPELVRKLGGS